MRKRGRESEVPSLDLALDGRPWRPLSLLEISCKVRGFEMATNKNSSRWRAQTLAVRGAQRRSEFQETSEALYLTSGYAYEGPEQAEERFKGAPGYTYTRYGNPTTSIFEERMALLEGAPVGRATASGMAAVTATFLCCLRAGDHIVAARALFGAIRYVIEDVLARFGVSSTIVDGTDLAAWRAAIRDKTRILFFETPSNPTLEIVDIAGVSEIAHAAGALAVVDNAFASPMLQRPMDFGADIVVHSSTKYIDGQGRALGGIILCREDFLKDHLQIFLRNTGPSMSPFNAWLHLKSLETLQLRLREHCRNAEAIAEFLGQHKNVRHVLYPFLENHPQRALARKQMSGGGGIVTFEVAGGKPEAFRVASALKLIDVSNNLGDAKSLLTHPATTTHQRLTPQARLAAGVTDSMLRISVGLEDVADLRDDLDQALSTI
jgi:O-succinylhomoserine sulfhydrylase